MMHGTYVIYVYLGVVCVEKRWKKHCRVTVYNNTYRPPSVFSYMDVLGIPEDDHSFAKVIRAVKVLKE